MTNGERADHLIRQVRQIVGEMDRALEDEAWNLATRRAQEALELTIKAVLNEMSVEYPKTHDPVPRFAEAVRTRGIGVDAGVLDSLSVLSQELAEIRGPAFDQETIVTDVQARHWARRVEGALQFAVDLLGRLRAAR